MVRIVETRPLSKRQTLGVEGSYRAATIAHRSQDF
jgi:ribosomal protein S17